MLHTIYALFDHPTEAAHAKRALERSGTQQQHFSVVLHADRLVDVPVSDLALFETAAVEGGVWGAAIGGVLGAALGLALLGPFGLVGGGAIAAMVFGTATSTVIGSFTGVIAGSANPDPVFEELARGIENGKVLLTVDCPSVTAAEEAEAILKANHAIRVHRHAFRPTTETERKAIAHQVEETLLPSARHPDA